MELSSNFSNTNIMVYLDVPAWSLNLNNLAHLTPALYLTSPNSVSSIPDQGIEGSL